MIRLFDCQFAGGSIIGARHRETNTNNQDAYYLKVDKDLAVAIVSDGCSSCDYSEVGSKIGVKLIAKSIFIQAKRWMETGISLSQPLFWKRIKDDVLAYIRTLSNQMDDSISDMVNKYFLFTVVGAVITPVETVFFCLGDGVIIVNEEIYQIGPFENNAPPYLTYGLIETTLVNKSPDYLDFKVVKNLPTSEVETFLVGTDGVNDFITNAAKTIPGKTTLIGPIDQFWKNEIYFVNPESINHRLNLINREFTGIDWESRSKLPEKGRLPDDTTFIIGRRSRKEE